MSGGPSVRLVLLGYAVATLVFAVIQPLPHLPDEPAHLQYIRFLAAERRLPEWAPRGGEAGYESQHPPLSYLLYVPATWVLQPLGEVPLDLGLRVVAGLLGLAWLLLCNAWFGELVGPADPRRGDALAGVGWLPLVLLYGCHPNPDLLVALLATVVLWLCWRSLQQAPSDRRALVLGAALAGGLLTKLSALAAWPVVLLTACWRHRRGDRAAWRELGLTLALAALLAAPWFIRNARLYGSPVLKTAAPYGSALAQLDRGATAPQLLALTLRNTYLSSWCQPDWLPGWPSPQIDWPVFPVVLCYGALTALLLAGLTGLRRGVEPPLAVALTLGAVLLLGILAGQQLAFWLADVEFNMGGRYVLAAQPALALALASGLRNLPPRWRLPAVWVGLLLVMQVAAAFTIVCVLNPTYHAGWRPFTVK
ncbi:MAG: hypothetical protein IT204_07810 [Fimbriimonadaceae bacterium]|nr:hypothetical protein [Fimbriimonadaceae bacterium]